MKLFYSAFAVAMLSLFPADVSAENYLVREDRVWEYEAYTGHEWNSRYEYKMRFDGVTEIDGKIYNNLIVYDAFAYWSDWPDPELNKKELDHAEKYLLREESGKVYFHVPDDAVDEWSADRPEALIYDFNASEGDDMSVVSSGYGMCPAKVMSVYDVSVNGEKCRAYNIKREGGHIPMDNAENDEYIVVEGLGNIIWGCLPFFYTTLTTGAMSFPLCVPDFFWKESLYRVTDLDGNVICEKTDGKWPWERPAQTGSIVREDRVWNYTLDKISYENISTVDEVSGYHFSGTRNLDGQTYSVFLDGDDKEVAFMRQDGGKVYRHMDEELKKCLLMSESSGENLEEMYGDNPTEIMLYNFDAQPGDSFYMPVFDDSSYFEMCEFTVEAVRDINISGEMMTFQYLSGGYVIVNGIGPDHGMLHCPEFGWLNTGMTNYYYFIKDVFDADGKELFRRNDFDSKKHHTLIRKDREWEYRGSTRNDVFYTLKLSH